MPEILSKTLNPVDFLWLRPELTVVDRYFASEREQHPMRRWEYALALRALTVWRSQQPPDDDPYIYDVGGAGSPFRHMPGDTVRVIDPDEPRSYALEDYVREHPRLASCVFCISVIEHVENLDQFLYHLSCLVAPGGLLFLTFDYCDGDSPDPYGWPEDRYDLRWMRRRIFNQTKWLALRHTLGHSHFRLLGDEIDYTWHGEYVSDYTFASLALVKQP